MSGTATARADALMGELRKQGGGGLTVFLGAAPGVGKTYAMLARAREARRQGVDVVAGIVETHGRAETAALLDGLELLPRRRIEHRGHVLEELDLDALLARRPQLALVDELAHRNAPGSRHERRWQDVVELLDAGIDVHTTVNIQHLESLNDVVHRITGVRVFETVPDAVFDRLRDIVLVDLPPGELIRRLEDGKVYLPEQAAHALQAFFSPANLTALRELAMQTAADRVDADLRETQAARGLPGLSLRRRVLVAIDGRGQSEYLVRVARRLAERRDAPWSVVTVQAGGAQDERRARELEHAFALARRLGADTAVLHGDDIVDAILDHAAHAGVSTIVLGRTRERPFARMVNRTLTQRLLQRGAHYELTIVSTPEARARSRRLLRSDGSSLLPRADALLAVGATAAATALAWVADRWIALDELSLVYLVAVVLVAARTRMSAAVLAAGLSFLAYNFFFIEPRFTLEIGARRGVATVVLFLVAALVAGRLASRLRMQVLALRAANAHATALQALGRRLANAADIAQVAAAGREALQRVTGADALVQPGDAPLGRDDADATGGPALDDRDLAAADWARRHRQSAGRFTDTLGNAGWWFVPLGGEPAGGVMGLRFPDATARLPPEQQRLVEAMAEDIGQALARTRLVRDLETARVSGETERLRAALLSSVSHDLRSPLAAIIGSASSLEHFAQDMPEADRRGLLETIRTEGERLDRYIQNLLDMTRLGHGGLSLNRDWIGVDELVGAATARIRRLLPVARLEIDVAAGLAPLWVHPALLEQALFNVVENAVKFSPPGAAVRIAARDATDGERRPALRIDIDDRGPGIPADERARIFDMFYSVERGDRGRQGTGLGLTIAQGMVGAHGGAMEALSGPDGRGTRIRITLPRLIPPGTGEGREQDPGGTDRSEVD